MTTGILHDWSAHSATCVACGMPFPGSVADDCRPCDAAEPDDAVEAMRALVEAITRPDLTPPLGRADLDAAYQRSMFSEAGE